jgi:transcriptional regulator with XRE-family HTH domain
MRQKDLSLKVRCATKTITHIECGVNYPSRAMLKRICEALDVPLHKLLIFALEDSDIPTLDRVEFKGIQRMVLEGSFNL